MVTSWSIQLQCIFNIKDENIHFSHIIDIYLVIFSHITDIYRQRPNQPSLIRDNLNLQKSRSATHPQIPPTLWSMSTLFQVPFSILITVYQPMIQAKIFCSARGHASSQNNRQVIFPRTVCFLSFPTLLISNFLPLFFPLFQTPTWVKCVSRVRPDQTQL